MITYRQATPADIPALIALLGEMMEHHGVKPPENTHLTATISAILDKPDHLILVADKEGRIVGMCALLFSHSTLSASLVCELQDLVVTHLHRHSRVGRGLVQAAEKWAKTRGCSRLFLLTESWNLEAHAFYRHLGLAEKTCLYFERDLTQH